MHNVQTLSGASYTEVISTKFKSTFFFIHRLLPIVDFAQRHTAAPPSGLSSALNTTTVVPVHRHNHLKSVKNKHHRVKNCDLVVSACVLVKSSFQDIHLFCHFISTCPEA
ncbi:hypothetical protein QVD17_15575 [Tagetes erecta]|uniref:Uncharacterized protein n=1 Tax=Tagetes erecta TaxID=13708 RepID=A0AAD8KW69_TARER|nr:hypothetical protein QVD17_15575 [Tagetes erecta]